MILSKIEMSLSDASFPGCFRRQEKMPNSCIGCVRRELKSLCICTRIVLLIGADCSRGCSLPESGI